MCLNPVRTSALSHLLRRKRHRMRISGYMTPIKMKIRGIFIRVLNKKTSKADFLFYIYMYQIGHWWGVESTIHLLKFQFLTEYTIKRPQTQINICYLPMKMGHKCSRNQVVCIGWKCAQSLSAVSDTINQCFCSQPLVGLHNAIKIIMDLLIVTDKLVRELKRWL